MYPNQRTQDLLRLCRTLVNSAKDLNNTMMEFRHTAEEIAGCSLDDWPFELVQAYMDLLLEKWYLEREIFPVDEWV